MPARRRSRLVIAHNTFSRAISIHGKQCGIEILYDRSFIAIIKRDAQVNRHNVVGEHTINARILGDESIKRLNVRHPTVDIPFGEGGFAEFGRTIRFDLHVRSDFQIPGEQSAFAHRARNHRDGLASIEMRQGLDATRFLGGNRDRHG